MNRAACVTMGLGMAAVTAGVVAWAVLRGGISTRPEPGALEARVARALRSWAIPRESRELENPIPPGPGALAEGLAHFADHCASCHGNDGRGRTPIGRALYPRAPDLREAPTQQLTDGELFYIIEHGVRFTGMPGWGGSPGSAEGSWHLVHFIRHLPRLTPDEQAQMEALNPRTPAEWRSQQEEDAFLRGEPAPEPRPGGHAHH